MCRSPLLLCIFASAIIFTTVILTCQSLPLAINWPAEFNSANLTAFAKSRSIRSHMPYFESSEGSKGGRGPGPKMEDGQLKYIPLKEFVDRAKGNPVLMDIISRALQRVGFDKEQAVKLIQGGKATFKGDTVSMDDVSKFCCPLGV